MGSKRASLANRIAMASTGKAKQNTPLDQIRGRVLLSFSASLPPAPGQRYSETVCTTLLTGRVLATGSFVSLIMASS